MSLLSVLKDTLHHHNLKDLLPFIDQCVNRDFRQRLRIRAYFAARFDDVINDLPYKAYLDLNKVLNDMTASFISSVGLYFSQIMESKHNIIVEQFDECCRRSQYCGRSQYGEQNANHIDIGEFFTGFMPQPEILDVEDGTEEMDREQRVLFLMRDVFGVVGSGEAYHFWLIDLVIFMGVDEGFYGDSTTRFNDLIDYINVENGYRDFIEYIGRLCTAHHEEKS